MSIDVMNLVWEHFPASEPTNEAHVMIALADFADEKGGSIYPSMSTIAKKCGLSVVQTRTIVRKLQTKGFIKVTANHFGGDPSKTRHYEMDLKFLKSFDKKYERKRK